MAGAGFSFDLGNIFNGLIGHPKDTLAAQQGQIGAAEAYANAQIEIAKTQSAADAERNKVITSVATILVVGLVIYAIVH
jgi:hypothetical protein